MINGTCNSGTWGFLGDFGLGGWIGLILTLIFWVGLFAGLTLLVIWAIRRGRVPAATDPHAVGQPAAMEILQAQYARGEITHGQYELKKRVIG